jgi:hypothetical protein
MIRIELFPPPHPARGHTIAVAYGISVRGRAPVLSLCRMLMSSGVFWTMSNKLSGLGRTFQLVICPRFVVSPSAKNLRFTATFSEEIASKLLCQIALRMAAFGQSAFTGPLA